MYDLITRRAERLVQTGEDIENEFGIPIVNKRISVTPVALLLAGILLVMGAYRLFSWLCSRGLTDTLTWVLGAAALVLAALGLLLASRSFRRLKELHL